jgi:flagellar assembly protein FliH
LSNVIKAAAVTYTQEIRTIDSNLREGGFTRLAVEKRANVSGGEVTEGFKPGIPGIFSDQGGVEPEDVPEDLAAEFAAEKARLEQLKKEAEDVLSDAREEVKKLLAGAKVDAEEIRKQAYADGLRQGEQKAKEKYDSMKVGLEAEVKRQKEDYERQVSELEPTFAEILIKLLEKLTGVLLAEKQGIIAYLLEQAIRGIEPGMTYLVHVSAEDFPLANSKKGELLRDLKEGAVLEIIEDRTMQKGQCIIETDSRIFDCGIDTQMKNLAGDLRLLAGGREG